VLADAGGRLTTAELCRRAGTTLPTLKAMERDGVIALARERWEADSLAATAGPPRPPRPTLRRPRHPSSPRPSPRSSG
jgi:hypothetical protein